MSDTPRSNGAIIRSQVDVPMILTSVPSRIPEPTAPRCASNAPTATGIPAGSPSRAAQSAVRRPAGSAAVYTHSGSVRRTRTSRGSSAARNASSG